MGVLLIGPKFLGSGRLPPNQWVTDDLSRLVLRSRFSEDNTVGIDGVESGDDIYFTKHSKEEDSLRKVSEGKEK